MKAFIVGIALIILMTLMLVFQSDNYNCRLETENLKYCCEEASDSASLCYTEIHDKKGYKIYDEQEGIRVIERTIKNYLKTNENLEPIPKSYWTEKINYTAYFFDDDKTCSIYRNGAKIKESVFNYPFLFTDEELQYKKSISSPNVIVTINAGKSKYRLSFIKPKDIIRSSGYEYEI
ncbi:hypothetical protein JYG23_12430 [Sedimentibacter sp. zth1]|uniref:hypothetical protein n=1 Tax=Sedimentibacter sp. zth1 TaxID=2816908 RepID=UPI001A91BAB4|nr:hypothetical protein [Sedimentibacter sp. zth1]QSX05475.1 hypothetical protein JYG23_12430 [Sedimentibacter sp. zth1]